MFGERVTYKSIGVNVYVFEASHTYSAYIHARAKHTNSMLLYWKKLDFPANSSVMYVLYVLTNMCVCECARVCMFAPMSSTVCCLHVRVLVFSFILSLQPNLDYFYSIQICMYIQHIAVSTLTLSLFSSWVIKHSCHLSPGYFSKTKIMCRYSFWTVPILCIFKCIWHARHVYTKENLS